MTEERERRTTRVKVAAADRPVPQTQEQAIEAIAAIGAHQRERARIQADMNDELARIKQKFEDLARPHNEEIQALSAGVHTWAEANREDLTHGGKVKTAILSSGKVSWRLRPPRVLLRNVVKVIEALRALGMGQYIRVKEEVDKEAILRDPDLVKHVGGISISQGEDFVIQPFEMDLEEIA